MRTAQRLAETIRRKYRITGVATEEQIEAAILGRGFRIWTGAELTGPIRGFRLFELIVVAKNATPGERRAVLAHELGHALLHTGNALYMRLPGRRMLGNRQEYEAQVFAITLLLGSDRALLDGRLHEAFEDGIPLDFLCTGLNALLAHVDAWPVVTHNREDVDVTEWGGCLQ